MKLLLALIFSALTLGSAAAQTPVLICENTSAKLVIGICGISGCTATVQSGIKTGTHNVRRVRYQNGALDYVPGPRAIVRCTFKVSALRFGVRTITNVPACAPALKLARCHWVYP